MYDDLMSLLDQADPETLQMMLKALGAPETMGVGHELLGTPGAEGRNVGHTYVASSPLEHLGVAAQRGLGAYMMGRGQQQRGAGIRAYIEALRGRRGLQPDPYAGVAGAQYANESGSGD